MMTKDEARQREDSSGKEISTGTKGRTPGGSKTKGAGRGSLSQRGWGSSPLGAGDPAEPGRSDILAALEAGLADALPGIEVLDRDVAFDEQGHADLVGVDCVGRLVIVLIAGEDADRALLDALDAFCYGRKHARLLGRHIGGRRLNPEHAPRIVVIDPSNDVRLGERLVGLAASGFEVLGVRTLRSAAGEHSYLVPHPDSDPARHGPRGVDSAAGVETFLRELPTALQEVGRILTQRMSSLDEGLAPEADRGIMVWRLGDRILARIECRGNHLSASIDPHDRSYTIRDPGDSDQLLELALARLVEAFDEEEEDELSGVGWGTASALGAPEGPILTQEEIQAFQG